MTTRTSALVESTRLSPTEDTLRRVTFVVHAVEPLDQELDRFTLAESLKWCLTADEDFCPEIAAVSDESCSCLALPAQNALLAAVHLAFSRHLPLTLSPDMMWLAILHGFARHVKVNAKELEGRMMKAPGKHAIQVDVTSETSWPEVFESFAAALQHHGGSWVRELESDFSTTGAVERTASHVALMEVFSPYVRYVMRCICGIPSITLEGEVADWQRLRDKLPRLRGFDADEWIDDLDVIAAQFVDAAAGNPDRAWWQQIYKLTPVYGSEKVEGWIGALFPYLRDEHRTFTRRRQPGATFSTDVVPPGLADVGVTCATRQGTETLRIAAGFIGVEYRGSEGVRPKIGWAVLKNHFMEGWVKEMGHEPRIRLRPPVDPDSWILEDRDGFGSPFKTLPIDLQLFYRAADGASLYGKGEIASCSVYLETTINHGWHYLGRWQDGSMLLAFGAIVRAKCTGGKWEHQTIGLSFSDFISRLVNADGSAYWDAEDFVAPVIMPLWMAFTPPRPCLSDPSASCEKMRRQNRRLRSMKKWTSDQFHLLPPSALPLDHLPEDLAAFYRVSGGLTHDGVCEIWEPHRVAPVPHTQGRWWEIGVTSDGMRLLLDVVTDRGVALLGEDEEEYYGGMSLSDFLGSLAFFPGELFWIRRVEERSLMPRQRIFWPDEFPRRK